MKKKVYFFVFLMNRLHIKNIYFKKMLYVKIVYQKIK
jgi:hypothetical protein